MGAHNEIGRMGEMIGASWLDQHGLAIVERNYNKKWGEIDIVARETGGKIHFVEVKTVSYGSRTLLQRAVSHGTWRPEENVHRNKQLRFARAIRSWLAENSSDGAEWQIDILALRLVPREKYCSLKFLENVIFDSFT